MSDSLFDDAAHALARVAVARWKLGNAHALYGFDPEFYEFVKEEVRRKWPEVDLDYDEVHDVVQEYVREVEEKG